MPAPRPRPGSARRTRRGCRSWRSGNGRSAARAARALATGRAPLHQEVERGEEAGAVGARLAVQHGRIVELRRRRSWREDGLAVRGARRERTTNSIRVMPSRSQASFCKRPGAVLAAAAQVDDRAHALGGEAGDLVRRRLGRAPEPMRDLMLVEVGEPEDAVIGEQHVGPGRDAAGRAVDRPVPARDAGHAPRVAGLEALRTC